ncbi:MAG: class I SAM-dependent methyltransferase [Clostridiaceae bacterium]|nr:class I SAM-dependent methyltransferase [Clostridiaceae bacterium]
MEKSTDWTKYYSKKKSVFSNFAQRFTLSKILSDYDTLSQFMENRDVIELGGGNSCFAESLCRQRKLWSYDIIDNNELAVTLFQKKKLGCLSHNGIIMDLTEGFQPSKKYDLVYSIGLIEHFKPKERERVIQAHFSLCRKGGGVLISFPTPTLKYRFWRKVLEVMHLWQFYDEMPLQYGDVENILTECGKVVKVEINRKLFLTQMIVLFINKGKNENESETS